MKQLITASDFKLKEVLNFLIGVLFRRFHEKHRVKIVSSFLGHPVHNITLCNWNTIVYIRQAIISNDRR